MSRRRRKDPVRRRPEEDPQKAAQKDIDSVSIEWRKSHYPPYEFECLVYGYGVYEESSVLAGQTRRVFLDRFETEDERAEGLPQGRRRRDGVVADPQGHRARVSSVRLVARRCGRGLGRGRLLIVRSLASSRPAGRLEARGVYHVHQDGRASQADRTMHGPRLIHCACHGRRERDVRCRGQTSIKLKLLRTSTREFTLSNSRSRLETDEHEYTPDEEDEDDALATIDDNFGHWEGMDDPEMVAFYHRTQGHQRLASRVPGLRPDRDDSGELRLLQ